MTTIIIIAHWLERYTIVLMFAVFSGILAFTYWPGRKRRIEQQASIPFESGQLGARGHADES